MSTRDRAKERTLAIPQKLLANYPSQAFAVRLWDGTVWPVKAGQPPSFTLVLTHPGALRRMFLPPTDLTLGRRPAWGTQTKKL